VDEFLWPCRSEWAASNDDNDDTRGDAAAAAERMWASVMRKITARVEANKKTARCGSPRDNEPFAVSFPCLRYGLNGHAAAHDESVVKSYVRRASYLHLDDEERLSMEDKARLVYGSSATLEACKQSPTLCKRPIGLYKGAYFPNNSFAQTYFPNSTSTLDDATNAYRFATLHGPYLSLRRHCRIGYDWRAHTDNSLGPDATNARPFSHWRHDGLCCNHIAFRSLAEVVPKYLKNRNVATFDLGYIARTNVSSPIWAMWDLVHDAEAHDLMKHLKVPGY